MGRIITPKYRVEYRTNHLALGFVLSDMLTKDGKRVLTMCWDGPATMPKLKEWRVRFNRSFQKGGANEHLSQAHGEDHIHWARIVNQKTGQVVAEVTAPTFEVT